MKAEMMMNICASISSHTYSFVNASELPQAGVYLRNHPYTLTLSTRLMLLSLIVNVYRSGQNSDLWREAPSQQQPPEHFCIVRWTNYSKDCLWKLVRLWCHCRARPEVSRNVFHETSFPPVHLISYVCAHIYLRTHATSAESREASLLTF
jgi:hypothetical protein